MLKPLVSNIMLLLFISPLKNNGTLNLDENGQKGELKAYILDFGVISLRNPIM
ncbi:MAG: hypothetical protein ACFFCQ_09160 [Promethearchaeota archaeon]